MFGKAFKIGKILGFKIEISYTLLFLLAIYMLYAGILGGLIFTAMLFGSVLVHELGHSVVARRLGVRILGIELHFFGGAAKMATPPRTAREEIYIAVAGPVMSFLLGVAGVVAYVATGWSPLRLLAGMNLVLGVFNLLPALPMDGGRVLRAALSARMGRYRATHVAATVAQSIAVVGGVVALVLGAYLVVGVAVLLWVMAANERAMAAMWRYQDEAQPVEVLDREGRIIAVGPDGAPYPAGPLAAAGANGPVRRVYRLPNGTVMVVEETRW
jgi:Zn-dependent protease